MILFFHMFFHIHIYAYHYLLNTLLRLWILSNLSELNIFCLNLTLVKILTYF